jgi:hypothetical protein
MAIYDSVGLHEIRGFDPSYRARGRSARTGRGVDGPAAARRNFALRLAVLMDEQHQVLLGELALLLRGQLSGAFLAAFLAGNQQHPRAKPADAAHLKSG